MASLSSVPRMTNQSIKVLESQSIISGLIANYLFFLELSSLAQQYGGLSEGIKDPHREK